ncbi:MAG: iron-containing alcohol dehydrogenase, partial [Bacteroidales bacterium]|nr:iron-containing alcohol dehydrogenase [Bacteroidales bacterium]
FAVLKNPEDYRNRAQIMWAGSLAHNGLTGCGRVGDWATHQIGHELSALFDATHGAALAAIWPSWARYVMKEDVSRFVRFAVNVMDVPNDYSDPEGTAIKGVEAVERFYHAIGMPINIPELIGRNVTDDEIKEMARKCTRDYTTTMGQFKKLTADDIEQIYRMAN